MPRGKRLKVVEAEAEGSLSLMKELFDVLEKERKREGEEHAEEQRVDACVVLINQGESEKSLNCEV